jgi:hypothetical protein
MTTKIMIQSDSTTDTEAVQSLVKSAVNAEISKLKMALESADRRLSKFEEQYQITSDYFIHHTAAEELSGGDDEYVIWAGEYRLRQRLQEKLRHLQTIEYGSTNVSR